jgi:hypothetical protein
VHEVLTPLLPSETQTLTCDHMKTEPVLSLAQSLAAAPPHGEIVIPGSVARLLSEADTALVRNGLSARFVEAGQNLVTHYSRRDAAAGRAFLKSLLEDCPDDDGAEIPEQFARSLSLLAGEAAKRLAAWSSK